MPAGTSGQPYRSNAMLCDRYLDELAETFEAGFAANNSAMVTVDAAVQGDDVRLTAWLDGASFSDPTFADSLVRYQRLSGSASTLH
jgi:hypothetical protein